MTTRKPLEQYIQCAEDFPRKMHVARMMLGRAAKAGKNISIITHRDPDGLMSEKIIINRYGNLSESGETKGLYQPPEAHALNEQINRDIRANPPDLMVVTDLRAEGKIFKHIDKIRVKHERMGHTMQLLWVDHHIYYDQNAIASREINAESEFLEVNSQNYGYPASRLCYEISKMDENLPWAAIGILGDKADSNIESKRIVMKAAKKVDMEVLLEAKDILELIGYARKGYAPELSSVVVEAKTVEDLIEDPDIKKAYEPIKKERSRLVGYFLSEAQRGGVNCFPYRIRTSEPGLRMGTICINDVAEKHPDWNLIFYQNFGPQTRMYLRRGDQGIDMKDLVKYCKCGKDGKAKDGIVGGGHGAVGALTVSGKNNVALVLKRHGDYCELMDKPL